MKEIQGIAPEIIAAISASIRIVLANDSAEHRKNRQDNLAVRINRTHRVWLDAGRQYNMSNRLFR